MGVVGSSKSLNRTKTARKLRAADGQVPIGMWRWVEKEKEKRERRGNGEEEEK